MDACDILWPHAPRPVCLNKTACNRVLGSMLEVRQLRDFRPHLLSTRWDQRNQSQAILCFNSKWFRLCSWKELNLDRRNALSCCNPYLNPTVKFKLSAPLLASPAFERSWILWKFPQRNKSQWLTEQQKGNLLHGLSEVLAMVAFSFYHSCYLGLETGICWQNKWTHIISYNS